MANEQRLRVNLQTGLIADNPLSTTTTVINSPGFATLPVVTSTQHLVLVINPNSSTAPSTNAEAVYVTAHSSGATVATVVRAREGTTASGYNVSTTWVHGPLVSDHAPAVLDTSGSLPSTGGLPYEGQLAWLMDDNKLQAYNGTAWVDVMNGGAWTSWTPSITGDWTLGSGSVFGRYQRYGRQIVAEFRFTVGNGVKQSNLLGLGIGNLPVANASGRNSYGTCHMIDTSSGTRRPGSLQLPVGTTTMYVETWLAFESPGYITTFNIDGTTPFTWATGDLIEGQIIYEAAS